jgi:pimeloyl-ACP methyl ester carboxylesterase
MILAWLAGLAALAIVALAVFLHAPDKPRAVLEVAYPADYRTVDGVRLRLRDTGPRDAPAVTLLHGFGASLDTWEPWAQALSARFRVICFDLPGFGALFRGGLRSRARWCAKSERVSSEVVRLLSFFSD